MDKLITEITRSLKLKAEPHKNLLRIKVGEKNYELPFEARLIVENDYAFIHIPPSASLMKLTEDELKPVKSGPEVQKAWDTLKQRWKKYSQYANQLEIPEELTQALKTLPKGYKISYDRNGTPKIVRARKRRVSAKIR